MSKLKCEERGFNPPGKWDCKKNSTFKYKMKDNTLKLTYKGVEVKFYNMTVEVNESLETRYPGLYIIGDGSGITHSLSHASASGVLVARDLVK